MGPGGRFPPTARFWMNLPQDGALRTSVETGTMSLASSRGGPLGAVGGALGTLPLLALARTLAARLFPVVALPGAERVAGDVKQASYLEVAVLFTAVPAAALFFGRVLPRYLQARGYSYWASQLPGVGFAGSLLLWKGGLSAKAALAVGVLLALAGVFAGVLRRSRFAIGVAVLGLFLGGIAVYGAWGGLDLFEDGQILLGAQELARGARPYLDVYPVHGWGADGGWDSVLFRLFDEQLRVFRARRAVMTGLALAFLGVASVLCFGDAAWGAVGLLASLAFCPFLSERQMFPLLALCFLIRAARTMGSREWLWAGVLSAVTLFSTLDFGMIFVVAGCAGPLVLVLLERTALRRASAATLRFVLGAALGSAPFAVYLAIRGALPAFVRVSFWDIGAEVTGAWGLPAPSLAQAARDGTLASFVASADFVPSLWLLLAVLLAAGVLLVFRAADRAITPSDRAATICLLVAIVALRGALGRADVGHRMLYGVFAGLPAAWVLYRAISASTARRLTAAVAILAFLVFLRPDRVIALESSLIVEARHRSQGELPSSGRVPGLGSARLPIEQARELSALRILVDRMVPPGKTFFDFGNEPGLYFVLKRRSPVRYSSVPCYETPQKQREVIAALERERPPLAILASGTPKDAFDGVYNRDRAPLVAKYLDVNYRVLGRLGTRTLGVRREAP